MPDEVFAEPELDSVPELPVADEVTYAQEGTIKGSRPEYVPEKFWNADTGDVRIEMLAKSYAELERKFSARTEEPESGGDDEWPGEPPETELSVTDRYEIDTSHGLFEAEPEIDALLQEAGFTQAQAQLVYDLAAHVLTPVMSVAGTSHDDDVEEGRLVSHFGGRERWVEMSRQLRTWGKRHLPADVYDTLSSSYEGVLSLHRLMHADEPSVLRGSGGTETTDEASLRRMIRDPRYWRDRDPSVIRRVSEGFNRLYPGGS